MSIIQKIPMIAFESVGLSHLTNTEWMSKVKQIIRQMHTRLVVAQPNVFKGVDIWDVM
jgi:hypothetical protein